MKILSILWLVSWLSGCAVVDHECEDGRSWNEFYESCIDPCPANQDYDANGICVDVPSPDSTQIQAHMRYETPANTTSSASR